ncbi:aminoglycoside phosphotransferase family protein [Leifsonia shinshuensis]|uniref:phosphotransferase family protein n=1 Tax=Leifsonia shinshuensis TaxID=150026 RepID=UPI001F509DA1|nr:aminoglycoside phosphotransferase family protein [Leifsonia shinshuensis]MCI0159138.1 aminoglycoside phosphotransferase family protein [Leifsonia shinshuensis]
MVETDFVAPGPRLFDELVTAALRAAGESTDPDRRVLVDHGSANLVVLVGATAVRVSRTEQAAAEVERAQRVIDGLPPLPFAVPRSRAEPVRAEGLIAIAQRRLPGEPYPSGSGDPRELASLLDALHRVPLDTVRADLAHPRAFMGGDAWRELMTERVLPLLDLRARTRGGRAVEELAALEEPSEPSLVHGDLAGANVLWADGRVCGLLDWDLASAGDPAEDVAALATWHGWDAITGVVSPGTEHRARVIAATYPLQLVCFGIVHGRPSAEIDRAVERANRALAARTV